MSVMAVNLRQFSYYIYYLTRRFSLVESTIYLDSFRLSLTFIHIVIFRAEKKLHNVSSRFKIQDTNCVTVVGAGKEDC